MSTLREAVFWNVTSAPIRIALGLAQTAVIARVLTRPGVMALSDFALINSIVMTAILITSIGIPQVFSKVAAEILARGDRATARSFMIATMALRIAVWSMLTVGITTLTFLAPSSLPSGVSTALTNVTILTLTLLWGLLYDLAGLTGRLLSAEFEQKWQNVIGAASQAASLGVMSAGMILPQYALALIIGGMVLMHGVRILGHLLTFSRGGTGWVAVNFKAGFAIWRYQNNQMFNLSLDKVAGYFYSPPFLVLLAGYVFSASTVASLFLVLDLSSKLVATLAVPFSGLVITAFGRARVKGAETLERAMRYGICFTSVVGFVVSLSVGAAAIPLGLLIYGQPFGIDSGVVCLVMASLVVEFMILEMTNAYLITSDRSALLWRTKLIVAAFSISIAGLAFLLNAKEGAMLTIMFLVRVAFLPVFVAMCGVSRRDLKQLSGAFFGIALASAISAYFFGRHNITWGNILESSATVVGVIAVSALTVFRANIEMIKDGLMANKKADNGNR